HRSSQRGPSLPSRRSDGNLHDVHRPLANPGRAMTRRDWVHRRPPDAHLTKDTQVAETLLDDDADVVHRWRTRHLPHHRDGAPLTEPLTSARLRRWARKTWSGARPSTAGAARAAVEAWSRSRRPGPARGASLHTATFPSVPPTGITGCHGRSGGHPTCVCRGRVHDGERPLAGAPGRPRIRRARALPRPRA